MLEPVSAYLAFMAFYDGYLQETYKKVKYVMVECKFHKNRDLWFFFPHHWCMYAKGLEQCLIQFNKYLLND